MHIFISYSRKDISIVDDFAKMLDHDRRDIFHDVSILGGEEWWDLILDKILQCDIFIFVLSKNSRNSDACLAELNWAVGLNRYILPIRIDRIDIHSIPVLSRMQVLDYQASDLKSLKLIEQSIQSVRPRRLPIDLPLRPPMPITRLDGIAQEIASKEISLVQQEKIIKDLQAYLDNPDTQIRALFILQELHGHPDIRKSISLHIDKMLIDYSDVTSEMDSTSNRSVDQMNTVKSKLSEGDFVQDSKKDASLTTESDQLAHMIDLQQSVDNVLKNLIEYKQDRYSLSIREKMIEDRISRRRIRGYVECLDSLNRDEFTTLAKHILQGKDVINLTPLRLALMFDADPNLVRQSVQFSQRYLPVFAHRLMFKILDINEIPNPELA